MMKSFRTFVVNINESYKILDKYNEHKMLIDRRTMWGNKYRIGRDGTRSEVIKRYEKDLRCRMERAFELKEKLKELVGKVLVCHCKPKSCHGDVLVKLIREYGLEK